MKILLTGASGLLGRELKNVLEKQPTWEVIGTAFNRATGNLRKLDLRNEEAVNHIVEELRPDVIVHSAAERNYGAIAKDEQHATQLNVEATENLAKSLDKLDGFFLYIGTNLVFDGTAAPYKTADPPKPANQYGFTKLAGEEAVQKSCKHWGILRLPMLYGDVEYIQESGPTALLPVLQDSSKKVILSNYERKYPTCTNDVAEVCKQVIQRREMNPEFSGIWHWCGNERYTKYEMALVISKLFDISMDHIEPSEGPVGRHYQPYDCQLDSSVLEDLGIGQYSSLEVTLKGILTPFVK